MVVVKDKAEGEMLFNWHKILVIYEEKLLDICCTTFLLQLMILNYKLQYLLRTISVYMFLQQ
jgi:hypothetical protein